MKDLREALVKIRTLRRHHQNTYSISGSVKTNQFRANLRSATFLLGVAIKAITTRKNFLVCCQVIPNRLTQIKYDEKKDHFCLFLTPYPEIIKVYKVQNTMNKSERVIF